MAEILDTEVVLISRKAIAIMTSLFAYIDLFAPMHVSFTMYLLTGSSAVRYGIFLLFNSDKIWPLKVSKFQKHFSWNSIAQKTNKILGKILPYEEAMKLGQNFCLTFCLLGNGDSRKSVFVIYWPLSR